MREEKKRQKRKRLFNRLEFKLELGRKLNGIRLRKYFFFYFPSISNERWWIFSSTANVRESTSRDLYEVFGNMVPKSSDEAQTKNYKCMKRVLFIFLLKHSMRLFVVDVWLDFFMLLLVFLFLSFFYFCVFAACKSFLETFCNSFDGKHRKEKRLPTNSSYLCVVFSNANLFFSLYKFDLNFFLFNSKTYLDSILFCTVERLQCINIQVI